MGEERRGEVLIVVLTLIGDWNLIMQVEMPIDNAIETLSRLGLVTETEADADGRIRVQAVSCGKAYEALKQQWNNLLTL